MSGSVGAGGGGSLPLPNPVPLRLPSRMALSTAWLAEVSPSRRRSSVVPAAPSRSGPIRLRDDLLQTELWHHLEDH